MYSDPVMYLILAIFVFGMNMIPILMPPTWLVLAFFYIRFDLSLIPVILIGAIAATSGRVILATLSRLYIRKFLPKRFQENYDYLGKYFQNNEKLTIPMVLLYAFSPIPSNQVFIIAGLAELNLKVIALAFFVGRMVSYSFWVSVAARVADKLESIFSKHLTSKETLIIEIIGLLIIYALGRIEWKKILKTKPNSMG